jgi:ribosomal protein L23
VAAPTRATSSSRRWSPRRATRCSTRTSTRSSSHPDANKTEIKIAVEQIFNVKVTTVNTLNRQGKRKRTRTGFGKRKDTKRAIVTWPTATASTSSAARSAEG